MTYDALDISKYIIERGYELGDFVSNLKLQKLLYFVQAEFMIEKDCPCFYNKIEAWAFGPVIPDVYNKYKMFGSGSVPIVIEPRDDLDYKMIKDLIMEEDKQIIDKVINLFLPYSAASLTDLTLNQKPWIDAYVCDCLKIGEITNEALKEYFL